MRIGGSLLLIAIGAILEFAVHPTGNTHGIDVGMIGIILMIVGGIGLLITLIWMSSRRRTDVIRRNDAAGTRTTYVRPSDPDQPPY